MSSFSLTGQYFPEAEGIPSVRTYRTYEPEGVEMRLPRNALDVLRVLNISDDTINAIGRKLQSSGTSHRKISTVLSYLRYRGLSRFNFSSRKHEITPDGRRELERYGKN